MNRQAPATAATLGAEQRRTVFGIAAVVFLGMSTLGLVLPVLPLLIHDKLNYSATTVGWLMGAQAIATLVARPWSGSLTDRRGGRSALQYSMLALAGSGAFYSLATELPSVAHGSLMCLTAGRLLSGIGEGLLITGAAAWAISRTGMEAAGRAMSLIGLAVFAGLAVGAAMGATLEGFVGFGGVAANIMGISLLGAIAVHAMKESFTESDRSSRLRAVAVVGRIWKSGMTLALAGTGFAVVTSFLALAYAAKGWQGGALAVATFAGGHVTARLVCGGLVDRVCGPAVAACSIGLEALGLAILWLAPNEHVALCGAALTGLGFSMVYPLLALPALRRVDSSSRGMAIGLYDGFFDLAVGLTALGSGLIADRLGLSIVFMLASIACAVGALTAVAAYRAAEPIPDPRPAASI